MKKIPIAIWGASGHALVVSNIVKLSGQYEIIGFLDDVHPKRKGDIFDEKPILGGREALSLLKQKGIQHIVMGFGHCSLRIKVFNLLKKNKFNILTIIHPNAVISDGVKIGEGTVVAAGVIIDPSCKVGRCVILNNSDVICHGSRIDDGAHVCPGVKISGNVHVGFGSWIGIGSSIIEGVRIGAGSYIGAGTVVNKDIPEGVVVYGNPARIIRRVTTSF